MIFCCILPFLGSRVLGFRSGFDFFGVCFTKYGFVWEGVCQSGLDLDLDLDLDLPRPTLPSIPPRNTDRRNPLEPIRRTNKQTGPSTTTRAVVRPHSSKPSPSCPDNPLPSREWRASKVAGRCLSCRPHRLTGKHTTLP